MSKVTRYVCLIFIFIVQSDCPVIVLRLLVLCELASCFSNHCSLNSVVRNFLFTFYYNGLFKMIDHSRFPDLKLD